MRTIAKEFRAAAMDGISEGEREKFVDTLLHMKSNLIKFQATDLKELSVTGYE